MSKQAEYLRNWRILNPGKQALYSGRWNRKKRVQDPDYQHRATILCEFGITHVEYDILLAKQNNTCAICCQPETAKQNGKILRLAVDPDHKTDKIRGLLCRDCNLVLGLIKDDLGRLASAIDYLTP